MPQVEVVMNEEIMEVVSSSKFFGNCFKREGGMRKDKRRRFFE